MTGDREPGPEARPDDCDQVWVVIPMFNEAHVIQDVVRDVLQCFGNVVCVDDGSTDDSGQLARRAGARVVTHPINLGQGAALQTGFQYALADPAMKWVATFDADGQHQVLDLVAMLQLALDDELDIVFGSRFLDERSSPGWLRTLILRLAVAYTNVTSGIRLTDAHNGLRIMSRDLVRELRITQNRMAHASEIVNQIGRLNVRYGENPVHVLYTEYSRSKGQSLWNSLNILVELIFR